jgi:thioesterase domain-containing protein
MTLAAWGWLMLELDAVGLVAEVYVADSQIRYLAPLYDDLLGEARLAPDQDWPSILRTLRDRRRARCSMQAQVFDAAGRSVATLSARFALILAPTVADAMA